ncbi:hypothetical protein PINS_up010098 [Pythium insidiosum]|nr:hypothetical protein PINS_up010098 [Pythium insidiosum]
MDLEALAQISAAGLAGVFTGAAAFMTLAQHPALLEMHRAEFQAPYFRRMYFYAARMQAPMAIGSGLSSMTVYLLQRGRDCGCQNRGGMPRIWLLSGTIMMAIVPYTMTRMLALNRRLTDTKRYKTYGRDWLQLMLKRWGELHDVRTGASLIAFTGMLVALACSSQPAAHMPAHVH